MKTWFDLSYDDAYAACALDLYAPEEGAKSVYLYFHGGGLSAGDKREAYVAHLAEVLTASGVALVSANYRMMPDWTFPDFVADAASAAAWTLSEGRERTGAEDVWIGGSSAGAYLSAMLCFDPKYLAPRGFDPLTAVAGYILDAGQPTTHYAILAARGGDTRDIRVDEAAPVFHLRPFEPGAVLPRIVNITAEHDLPGRPEQNAVMLRTMRNFGWPEEKILDCRMMGYGHCGYMDDPSYHRLTRDVILGGISVPGTLWIPGPRE